MMTLAWLQKYGHRPIALMGGGTTMVGDPSGRTSERPIMTREAIAANAERLRPQFARFVDFDQGAMMLDNSDWLLGLDLIDFLRDVGSKFTINHMLAHETYKVRLEQGGLSFLELSYQLLQAYDFLHLFRTCECAFQVGGSDQWANILAGVDLIRRSERTEAFGLVWPLITTSSGAKMGKTADGAVWLDPDLLSPYEYYQFWINTEDADVERFLALFTFLPMEDVKRLGAFEGADLREAKEKLAFEVTTIVHGPEAAEQARAASRALFGGRGSLEAAPSTSISRSRLEGGINVADLVTETGLFPSKREARRQIAEGGLSLNGARIDSSDRLVGVSDLDGNAGLLLRAGKKKYLRVFLAD
jgi:tyrosyl-tRNA synthetase